MTTWGLSGLAELERDYIANGKWHWSPFRSNTQAILKNWKFVLCQTGVPSPVSWLWGGDLLLPASSGRCDISAFTTLSSSRLYHTSLCAHPSWLCLGTFVFLPIFPFYCPSCSFWSFYHLGFKWLSGVLSPLARWGILGFASILLSTARAQNWGVWNELSETRVVGLGLNSSVSAFFFFLCFWFLSDQQVWEGAALRSFVFPDHAFRIYSHSPFLTLIYIFCRILDVLNLVFQQLEHWLWYLLIFLEV